MQMPSERVLGSKFKLRASGIMKTVNECCYDIPLLESLQSLLNDRSIFDQVHIIPHNILYTRFLVHVKVVNTHKLDHGKMGDYCDGNDFQEHPLFSEDPCALQIRLYYDDLEICNALGANTKKHKLGMSIYFVHSIL